MEPTDNTPETDTPTRPGPPERTASCHVLVVEDNPTQRLYLCDLLRKQGYRVSESSNGREALALMRQDRPDAVVSDVVMPVMGGYEMCDVMKREQDLQDIPCILLTVLADLQDVVRGLKAGVRYYLTKPYDPDYLLSRLEKVLKAPSRSGGAGFKTLAEVTLDGERQRIVVDSQQMLDMLISTYDNILQQHRRLAEAQVQLTQLNRDISRKRDDFISVIDELRLVTAMADSEGRVTYVNRAGRELLGDKADTAVNRHWQFLLPWSPQDRRELLDMAQRPEEEREKVPCRVTMEDGREYIMEVEVRNDRKDTRRLFLFIYDVTEIHGLRRMLDTKTRFHDLIGRSESMQAVFQRIREVSQVDWTVLIEGETGTGKELVARAIHYSSPRKERPFIALNCAGLTDSLLSSQLFGHRKGAFTGATADQVGYFEAAEGGTLFLDEIGDISKSMQTTLLRALESREITRVGDTRSRKVDVRILTATHRNLTHEVQANNFRSDLLYRIRVARISLPPLRERRQDIPLLAANFLQQCSLATGRTVRDISAQARKALLDYAWPGNVRELKSAIETAVLHCDSDVLTLDNLPPEIRRPPVVRPVAPKRSPTAPEPGTALPGPAPRPMASLDPDERERQRIQEALAEAGGNKRQAAKLLGVSRATFYRRLERLGL